MPASRVLVVEDDLHTRRMIAMVLTRDRMLRYQRLEVVTAANGREGLRAFEEAPARLVITDLLMPEMDGFELIEAIRGLSTGKEVPILVTSAVIRNARVLRKLQQDFDVSVQLKPFSPRVLADRVRRVLRDHPLGGGARPQRPPAPKALAEPVAAALGLVEGAGDEAPEVEVEVSANRLLVPAPAPPLLTPEHSASVTSEGSFEARRAAIAAGLAGAGEETEAEALSSPEEDRGAAGSVSPGHEEAVEGRQTSSSRRLTTPREVKKLRSWRGLLPDAASVSGQQTVAAILLQLAEQQRSGSLDLRRDRLRKVVHVLGGYPIFVQSNLRAETLGQLLISRGGLDEGQHREVLALAQEEHIKYGEALVRAGFMSEADVMLELVQQTRLKVQNTLRWRTGEWSFSDDAEIGNKVPRCTIDPVETVLVGLRECDVHQVLAGIFEGGIERRLILEEPEVDLYGTSIAETFGGEVLEVLQKAPTLTELLAGDPALAVAAEALVQARLARYEELPQRSRAASASSRYDAKSRERRSTSREAPALDQLVRRRRQPELVEAGELRLTGAWAAVGEQEEQQREEDRVARALVEAAYLGLHSKSHYDVLGVIPETDANGIEVAFSIKRSQFDLSRFRERDIGADAYAHLEEICAALDEAHAVLSDPERRRAYDAHQGTPRAPQRSPGMRAEELFQEGQGALAAGEVRDAMGCFERAIELDDQPEYRVQEAWAYFLAEAQAAEAGAEAMVRVQAALALDPEQPGAHLVAAQISRTLGALEESIEHLRASLAVEPLGRDAFELLESILLERDDLDELEAEYRRAIFRVGSRDRGWSATLWKRLVLLYRDRLADPQRARKACDAAFRLNPEDGELRAVLQQLIGADGDNEPWPQAVLGFRALLRSNPRDGGPLRELYALHRGAGREDAALIAAQAALFRRIDDFAPPPGATDGSDVAEWGDLEAFVEEREAGALRTSSSSLNEDRLALLVHPDEDPGLRGLFDVLAPLLERLDPLTAEDLDLRGGTDDGPTLSADFSSVLRYACQALEMPPPRVVVRPELGTDIQAAGTTPPVLLAGSAAVALADRRELAFRIGRALALLAPSRRLVSWRSPVLLRDYLVAALRSVSQVSLAAVGGLDVGAEPLRGLPVEGPQGARAREALAADVSLLDACRPWVLELASAGDELDFGRWQRGAQRSADRLGLLFCTDLRTACRVIIEVAPEAEIELIDFALSERYVQLREQLGLGS